MLFSSCYRFDEEDLPMKIAHVAELMTPSLLIMKHIPKR